MLIISATKYPVEEAAVAMYPGLWELLMGCWTLEPSERTKASEVARHWKDLVRVKSRPPLRSHPDKPTQIHIYQDIRRRKKSK